MLSSFQQKELWDRWISAETRAHYYADLCGRFQRTHTILTWIVLICSSGAAATFLTKLPTWVTVILTLLVAAISLYLLVRQSAKKITECTDLSFRWNSLAILYQELWNATYETDAAAKLQVLMEKGAEISRAGHALPNDAKSMLRWEDHVLSHRIPNSPAMA